MAAVVTVAQPTPRPQMQAAQKNGFQAVEARTERIVQEKIFQQAHGAGCVCPGCNSAAKETAALELFSSLNFKEEKNDKGSQTVAKHEAGCSCPGCAGAAKETAALDLFGSLMAEKGKEAPDSPLAQHESGCSCPGCNGAAKEIAALNLLDSLLERSPQNTPSNEPWKAQAQEAAQQEVSMAAAALMASLAMERNQTLAALYSQENYNALEANRQTKYDWADRMQQVAWKPGSAIEEEHPRPKPEQQSHGGAALLAPEQEFAGYGMANFEVAGQPALRDREPANYDETTAHEKTGIFVKPDGTFHAAPEKTSIFVKDGGTFITGGKNYVIGAYTYEDILASAWLREMYGHLIGLAKTGEETRGSIQQNTQRDDSERSEGGSNPKEEGRGGGGGKKTGKNAETPKKTEERPPMMRNGKYYTIDLKGAAEELSKSKQGFLNMPGRGKKTESGQEPEARNESGKEKKEAHEAAKKGHGLGKKGGRTGKNTLEIPLRKPNGTQENWGAKKRQRKESMKMQNAGEASENARLRRASAGRRRKGASEKFAKEEMRKTDRLLRKLLKGRRAKRRRLLALALWKSSGEASKKRQKMPKKKNNFKEIARR